MVSWLSLRKRKSIQSFGTLVSFTSVFFVISQLVWLPYFHHFLEEEIEQQPVQPHEPQHARPLSLRDTRFPSFEERLKLYLSYWYLPPCGNDDKNHPTKTDFQFYPIESYRGVKIKPPLSNGTIYSLKPETKAGKIMILDTNYMLKKNALEKNLPIERYYLEFLRNIEQHWFELDKEEDADIPLILRFGDAIHPYMERDVAMFPFISKARPAMDADTLTRITSGTCSTLEQRGARPYPVLHMLGETRHLNPTFRVQRLDIPWEKKIPKAVFRGTPSGTRHPNLNVSTIDFKIDYVLNGNQHISSAHEFCKYRPRCRFVRRYKDSSLIDARLMREEGQETHGYYEESYGSEMTLEALLKYKAIVVIEGNDIATSLKWAMYSTSVVMMTKPTVTSWAMEELLVPWYHYVPLNPSMTDAEEKMEWILDHEEEAKKISLRASMFIHDLLFHRDARAENERLKKEILRRMRAHFHASDNLVEEN